MGVLQLIASSNFISVNKTLLKKLGLEETIILGELASEYEYWKSKNGIDEYGYFFSTIENIEEATTINGYKQRVAINRLKELGIIDVKIKGLPAKRYIKINENKIIKYLTTSCLKFKELDVQNLNTNKNINNNKKENIKEKYFDNDDVNSLFLDFLKMRTKLKAINSERAINNLLNILNKFDDNTKIQMINNSITNSWKGIFEIKNKEKPKTDTFSTDGRRIFDDEYFKTH